MLLIHGKITNSICTKPNLEFTNVKLAPKFNGCRDLYNTVLSASYTVNVYITANSPVKIADVRWEITNSTEVTILNTKEKTISFTYVIVKYTKFPRNRSFGPIHSGRKLFAHSCVRFSSVWRRPNDTYVHTAVYRCHFQRYKNCPQINIHLHQIWTMF